MTGEELLRELSSMSPEVRSCPVYFAAADYGTWQVLEALHEKDDGRIVLYGEE